MNKQYNKYNTEYIEEGSDGNTKALEGDKAIETPTGYDHDAGQYVIDG